MTRWGIWYNDGSLDLGWLADEGSHGRPYTIDDDVAYLREIVARERAYDAFCVKRGWPATTFAIAEIGSSPLRCLLDCPKCGVAHIDEGEWATTRKHKTHQCQACMHEWRPFAYPTIGVAPPEKEPA